MGSERRTTALLVLVALGCAPDSLEFVGLPGDSGDGGRDGAADVGADSGVDSASDTGEADGASDAGTLLTANWLAVGENTGCAGLSDGSVRCWGDNSYGQLAIGSTDALPHSRPVVVPALANARQVALSWDHGCVVWQSGGVACWGVNGRGWHGEAGGKLGIGSVDNCQMPDCVAHPLPEPLVAPAEAEQVAAGFNHSCTRTGAGEVLCWGANLENALGLVSADNDPHPTPLSTFQGATDVAVGDLLTCVVTAGGVVCWGYNVYGQAPLPQGSPILGTQGAVQVATNWLSACSRNTAGRVKCWGSDGRGLLGSGTSDSDPHPTPVEIPTVTRVIDLSVSGTHSCAVTDAGHVSCWGWNSYSQLGRGVESSQAYAPAEVPGIDDAVQVAAGGEHTCVRTRSGEIWCWGRNQLGQLGDGTTTSSGTPRQVIW